MATRRGYPAIATPTSATPESVALRDIQGPINNIRERFQGIEAEVGLLASIVGSSTTAQAIQSLQIQIAQLTAALNALNVQVTSDTGDISLQLGVFGQRPDALGANLLEDFTRHVPMIAAFSRHDDAMPDVRAGTNVTIVRDAQGYVVSSTGGGGGAVDSDQNILATQVYGA